MGTPWHLSRREGHLFGPLQISINRPPMSAIEGPNRHDRWAAGSSRHHSVAYTHKGATLLADFEQRPLDDVLLYQGFRLLLNDRCVIARRELTLDVQHEDAECQRLRLITSRP
jgi:hypothetical protein